MKTSYDSTVKSLDFYDGRFLVGLKTGQIFMSTSKGDKIDKTTRLINSHFDGESWGLGFLNEDEPLVATCGDDNKIIIYNFKERKCIGECKVIEDEDLEKAKKKKVKGGASTTSGKEVN